MVNSGGDLQICFLGFDEGYRGSTVGMASQIFALLCLHAGDWVKGEKSICYRH